MFPYYDFKPEEFTLKDFNDQTWGETDFPNTFERIFSRKFIDGAFWIRKQIILDTLLNEDYFFEVPDGIDDADYLYVNGFLVGLTNCYYCKRRYRIPNNYLEKENIFALLILDNLGEGGVRGPMYLSNSKEKINLSENWKFKQIFDIEILLTFKETDDFSIPLYQKSYSIFDLNGRTLEKNELLISENYQKLLLTTVILLLGVLLFLIFKLIKLNTRTVEPKKTIDTSALKANHIFVRSNRIDHKIEINDIFAVESKKDYVKIYTSSESFLVRKNLKTFLLELPEEQFIRISKSVALNIQKVEKINKNTIYLTSGYDYVIGKVYLKKINTILKKI
ncbi:MAG: LytTR family DNA-binding domain-containing protein [Flavobacteriaceae bacterium]